MFVPLGHAKYFGGVDLMLNNRGIKAHDVVPRWYLLGQAPVEGQAFSLPEGQMHFESLMSLLPAGVAIRDVVGLQLTYQGQDREVWAQALLRPVAPNAPRQNVDDPFGMVEDFKSTRLDAAWTAPAHGLAGVLALANTADHPVQVKLTLDGESRNIALKADDGVAIEVPSSRNGVSWAELVSDGAPGDLRATGFSVDSVERVPHLIRFYDPAGQTSAALFSTGVPVHNVDLSVALRNVTTTPVVASAQLLDSESGAVLASTSSIVIPAQRAVSVDVKALLAAVKSAADVALRVSADGGPGTIVGGLAAVDGAGIGYDIPLRDAGPERRSTGGYPWRLDGDYNTVMSITNVGSVPAVFVARLHYNDTNYVFRTQRLSVGATAQFDIREIRDLQIPDIAGHTVPPTLDQGQFYWTKVDDGSDMHMVGRAEVVSVSDKISSSYSCDISCPDSFTSADQPANMKIIISDTGNQTISETMQPQYGGTYDADVDASLLSWGTNDSGIATGDGGTDTLNGVGMGTTTVTAFWSVMEYDENANDDGTGDCAPNEVGASAAFTVETLGPYTWATVSDSYTSVSGRIYNRHRVLQVQDQDLNPLHISVLITESYSPNPPSGNCVGGTITTGSGYSDANGQFTDDYYLSGTPPNPCTSTSTQTYYAGGSVMGRTNTVAWHATSVDLNGS